MKGRRRRRRQQQQRISLPSSKKPLYDFQIVYYARKYKIPYFRGIYFRNYLPRKPKQYETAIVNMDLMENPGTHWVCYIKRKSKVLYFDPLGNVSPPLELLEYFDNDGNSSSSSSTMIQYNRQSFQAMGTVNCGHMCLKYLISQSKRGRGGRR